ncbi:MULTISPECIES: DUF3800 domain-containing protein [unclassified Bradyrhizobium]|uniref:DUF3800 domain-containing protein n=1 Tax=unclassified Bradyrhizobium TaxID=2631580 RepID=UPI0028E4EDF8|nr:MULTISPECIES: DUF3800 domain-containing protein [unclassified Bradyrhizobium]
MDIFYIDESERLPLSVASSVRIPFLRPTKEGAWEFVFDQYNGSAESWRRALSAQHSIRFREELHGYKILKHQGLYHKQWRNLNPTEAVALYQGALATLTWLPPGSIMSTFSTDKSSLMGHKGIDACLFGLFQRIRNDCHYRSVNGMIFFDDGHPSYIRLYRMAQKYLPTGSMLGGWGSQKTKNLPLSMFPKDANLKISSLSYFIQIADLVSYAVRLKLEEERKALAAKRVGRGHHLVYDSIPRTQLNTAATMKRRDAIVPT